MCGPLLYCDIFLKTKKEKKTSRTSSLLFIHIYTYIYMLKLPLHNTTQQLRERGLLLFVLFFLEIPVVNSLIGLNPR